MFDLTASDPIDLRPGDRIAMTTEIRSGDLVCVERTGPDRISFRTLLPGDESPGGDAGCTGAVYRIDRDGASGQIVLRAVHPAS